MWSCCAADAAIQLIAPLKGEDSPQRGEMSAQPTEWGVELSAQLTEGSFDPIFLAAH